MPPDTADAEGSSGEGAVVTGVACGSSHSLALLGECRTTVQAGQSDAGNVLCSVMKPSWLGAGLPGLGHAGICVFQLSCDEEARREVLCQLEL